MTAADAGSSRFRWDLDGLTLVGETTSDEVADRWVSSFAPRWVGGDHARSDLRARLEVVEKLPQPPEGLESRFKQDDLLEYHVAGPRVVVRFPRFGQLDLDLDAGTTDGAILPSALTTYGVFEDLVAVGLSPHLRRRGRYLVHAFAATLDGTGVLMVGGIGAGKTTTGLALLASGWNLLSNDSPLLTADGRIAAYPGLIAAFPDTLRRFPATRPLAATAPAGEASDKVSFGAEDVWPDIWRDGAELTAICFPTIEARRGHHLERLEPAETLKRLLPHTIERWDADTIPTHLSALRQMCERSTGYVLRLGPDPTTVSGLLTEALSVGGS